MTSGTLLVGLAGNITGVLLYASPTTVFWRIVRRGSTEAFSGVPYAFAILSTMQWTYFALLRGAHARPLMSLTIIGFVFQFAFNSIYLRFASKSQRKLQAVLLAAAASFYVCMVTFTTMMLHGQVRAKAVGIICVVNSIFFSASPLLILRRVIKTSSVEFMPFYLPLFMFVSGILWSVFSFLTRDVFIGIPNVVNAVLGGMQLALYAYYKVRGDSRCSSVSSLTSGSDGNDVGDSEAENNPPATTTSELTKSAEISQITCMF